MVIATLCKRFLAAGAALMLLATAAGAPIDPKTTSPAEKIRKDLEQVISVDISASAR